MAVDPNTSNYDVSEVGNRCRREALAAFENDDWHGVYYWTKGWIGSGGGAWLPDTWLLYAVSALLQGQPRSAVHSLDLGLGAWISGAQDRAALRWLRGWIVWRRLNDPKTALNDLDAAGDLPPWLGVDRADAVGRCTEAASKSRKRVPSVPPSPDLTANPAHRTVAGQVDRRGDGDEPGIWPAVARIFAT